MYPPEPFGMRGGVKAALGSNNPKGWSKGELPFLNYLIAQQRYFITNRDYLQSLLELRTSAAQIEGLLLSNSLGTSF